jgi:hypothetical protein
MSEARASLTRANRSKELDVAITAYIGRCKLLLKDAFRRNLDERRTFRVWIVQKFDASDDPMILLHEDPFYMVARYLGIPALEIDSSITARATRIAHEQGW